MLFLLTFTEVVQSIICSYDDATIAHLSYIIHETDIISRYSALLLKLTVKDHYASVTTATPELLVDDTQTFRNCWQLRLCLFHPLLRARLLQSQ